MLRKTRTSSTTTSITSSISTSTTTEKEVSNEFAFYRSTTGSSWAAPWQTKITGKLAELEKDQEALLEMIKNNTVDTAMLEQVSTCQKARSFASVLILLSSCFVFCICFLVGIVCFLCLSSLYVVFSVSVRVSLSLSPSRWVCAHSRRRSSTICWSL